MATRARPPTPTYTCRWAWPWIPPARSTLPIPATTPSARSPPTASSIASRATVSLVDNAASVIRKVDTKANITTIAGTGTAGFAGDGSDPTKAQLNNPTGIAVDGSGNVYVADFQNLRVRKVAGGNITTVAGNGL